MQIDKDLDFSNAIHKVKGYRFTILKTFGILFIFFAALSFFIAFSERNNVSTKTLVTIGVVCGIVALLALGLVIAESIVVARVKNKDCVILFEDGITVFVDKPKTDKGYKHFGFDELLDYEFINIIRKGSGETSMIFNEKRHSTTTYLYGDLTNYGYMRITSKDGGYYNVPVGDIQTVKDFLKERAPQIEEYIYMRIGGIHDNL